MGAVVYRVFAATTGFSGTSQAPPEPKSQATPDCPLGYRHVMDNPTMGSDDDAIRPAEPKRQPCRRTLTWPAGWPGAILAAGGILALYLLYQD